MEQVKIFTRGTKNQFKELETEVNKWLKENEGIDIIGRHVSGSAGVNVVQEGFVNCTIVIFYRQKS